MRPARPATVDIGGVRVRVWLPDGPPGPAALLVAHDGHDYAERGGLVRLAAGTATPPARVALLDVPDRRLSYAADETYARGLAAEVLPALRSRFETTSAVGIGASLGALAMLHAQERGTGFDALLLQSGSFFTPELDAGEAGFGRFAAVTAFVASLDSGRAPRRVPVRLTCGRDEENLANNRRIAAVLARRGYDARLREVPGGHDWASWRAALERALPELLAAMPGRS